MNAETLEIKLKECSENYNKELETVKNLEVKKKELPQERLKNLGFTSSFGMDIINQAVGKDLEFINTINKVSQIIAFIQEARKCFGENVIVIKRSDFVNIVEKYNLQCGSFSDYTGVVPEKNIDEIENVMSIIKGFRRYDEKLLKEYSYLRRAFVFSSYYRGKEEYDRRWLRKINEFSMTLKNRLKYRKQLRVFKRIPFIYDMGLTFDSSVDKQFGKVGFGRAMINPKSNDDFINNLFICAPRQEMKNSFKITMISKKRAEDPFICSFCDYGVIIYSSWGKEAEDEMLNKYKNFLRQ